MSAVHTTAIEDLYRWEDEGGAITRELIEDTAAALSDEQGAESHAIDPVELDRWEDEGGYVAPDVEPVRAARLTYRERRLARAEKLRGWAEKREQRAEEAYERATELGQMIPFGQPILVGHYSEKGHRAHLKRIQSAMDQSCENSAAAQRMAQSADEIERQAGRAIYSDDPDAIERLTAKIANLEQARDEAKAANAAYRREHRTELHAMNAWQRSVAVPFPFIANDTANIARLKQRLQALQRLAVTGPAFRTITARFDSQCEGCGQPIARGDVIRYARTAGAFPPWVRGDAMTHHALSVLQHIMWLMHHGYDHRAALELHQVLWALHHGFRAG